MKGVDRFHLDRYGTELSSCALALDCDFGGNTGLVEVPIYSHICAPGCKDTYESYLDVLCCKSM
jgi:hypothetical protein